MAGFATSASNEALLFWRGAGGVAGAAAWVALAGAIARWFPARERGMGQSVLAGAGGALGEGRPTYSLSPEPEALAWGTDLLDGKWNLVESVPATFNSALMFVPAADSWHAFRRRPIRGRPPTWA